MNRNLILGLFVVLGFAMVLYFTGAYSSTNQRIEQTTPTPTIDVAQPDITRLPSSPTLMPVDQEMMTLLVYFNNLQRNENCDQVFPVQRVINRTQTPAETSIRLLIDGPTADELDQGYTTSISEDSQLNSISIDNGTAYVDFNEELDASGSCAVLSIRSQITETLLQFPTINEVLISINGDSKEILQP